MTETAPKPRPIVRHWRTRDMEQAALNLRDNFANASRFKFDGGRDT